MKKSAFLLLIIILIAGCTQSGLTPIAKNLPEVKEFLNQYPEAAITASAYSPSAVKFVVKNFAEQCPNLVEEGKSYQKITIVDGKTKQMMIVWIEAKNNEFVCAIRTSLSGEIVTTTSSTTTTLPPTTTAQITTTSSTTTTIQPLPDLAISSIIINKDYRFIQGFFYHNFSYTITNIGAATSNATKIQFNITNSSAGNSTITSFELYVGSLAPGETLTNTTQKNYTLKGDYFLVASVDSISSNAEQSETNNMNSKHFPVPYAFSSNANLIISEINYIFKESLPSCEYYTINATVKNAGTENSNEGYVRYEIYKDGVLNEASVVGGSGIIPILATSQSYNVSIANKCTSTGTYVTNATADYYDMTKEINEIDNWKTQNLVVP